MLQSNWIVTANFMKGTHLATLRKVRPNFSINKGSDFVTVKVPRVSSQQIRVRFRISGVTSAVHQ
jgi:hypothetical protein